MTALSKKCPCGKGVLKRQVVNVESDVYVEWYCSKCRLQQSFLVSGPTKDHQDSLMGVK